MTRIGVEGTGGREATSSQPGARRPEPVTIALIGLNVLIFLYEVLQPSPRARQAFVEAWAIVPREFTAGKDFVPTIPLPYWSTVLTSMFLHSGLAHLAGNMAYLWIFGGKVERTVGHVRFLCFYVACGLAAGWAHIAMNPGSMTPAVGASGAISGTLAAYLILLFRERRPPLEHARLVAMLFVYALGLWVLLPLMSVGSLAVTGDTEVTMSAEHLGGFIAGILLAPVLAIGTRRIRLR